MKLFLIIFVLFNNIVFANENIPCLQSHIDIIQPGTEIFSLLEKKINCDINLLHTGPIRIETVNLNETAINFDTMFDILGMTKTGLELVAIFKTKISRNEIKIKKFTPDIFKEFEFQHGGQSIAIMAYVHSERTIFYNPSSKLRIGNFLISLVHELTHAKDLLNMKNNKLTQKQVLNLEESAFKTEDKFFEELAVVAPCLREMYPNYPLRMSRESIAHLYGLPNVK
ncbi:MAG: hypothetical protein AB7I27_17670 [Bacteriovoracaceae bacterium]